MLQGKQSMAREWCKSALRLLGSFIFLCLILTAIGIFAGEYLQNIDVRTWFIKTQWIWFGVRLLLYSVIIFMVSAIARRHPLSMPKKAKWLILMVLVFAEAITQISLV